jgi:iron complex outermembrane recepter protein
LEEFRSGLTSFEKKRLGCGNKFCTLKALDLGRSLTQNFQQAQTTKVTGVELTQTEAGLQVILEIPSGQKLEPVIVSEGNNLVIDIPNAVLVLRDRQEFNSTNPAEGITQVTVRSLNVNSIRVIIAGEKLAPTARVIPSQQNLVFGITSDTAQTEPEEELEILVTGDRIQSDYAVTNSNVG